MGLLWYTREKFRNCVIRVEYKVATETSNSGIFVRISGEPADPWFAVHHGYEIQIQDKADDFHRTGAVYSISPAKSGAARPAGEWNAVEITLDAAKILVTLNGRQITAFDPATAKIPPRKESWEPQLTPRAEAGYIGLQNHSDKDTVWFRKVTVRPLETSRRNVQ
jgi:Domain of Unknown Function (DUF1080)